MKIAQLLLVDANRDNLDILTFILSEKYRVSSHGSVSEALTALEAAGPDLLLLDIGMSPVDGVQCLEAVRGMPGYGSIPAIALTGYPRDNERKGFQAAGFHAVLTKPILDDELFSAITAVLAPSGDQGSDRPSVTTAA